MSCRDVSDVTEALGDPGLRDCLHPQRGLQQMEEVSLCSCDCYHRNPRGSFQGHGGEAVANDPHGRIMGD